MKNKLKQITEEILKILELKEMKTQFTQRDLWATMRKVILQSQDSSKWLSLKKKKIEISHYLLNSISEICRANRRNHTQKD